MKIIVLGAGAIGSIYGAKLSKLNDVLLVGNKKHAEAISKKGLKITGLENKAYKIKAAAKIEKIDDDTLILLTTKVTGSERAISSIRNLVKSDTILMCVQNGLYSENIAKKILGKKCLVLRAVTNFGAIFLKPGVVNYTNYSYTSIEKSARSMDIAENFRACGLNGNVSKNIRYDMWKKLIFNCVLNPITSILKVENNGVADERLNPLKELVVNECLEVARKDGIEFELDFVKEINKVFKNSRNISSMQQDIMKGKKTEIDYLNGGVAELGRKYGVECPVNEALVEIIKGMEKSVKQNRA